MFNKLEFETRMRLGRLPITVTTRKVFEARCGVVEVGGCQFMLPEDAGKTFTCLVHYTLHESGVTMVKKLYAGLVPIHCTAKPFYVATE